MEIKSDINRSDYEVGVLIARFQVDDLHQGHKELIEDVMNHHKKVIIFLGVSRIQNTKKNPLNYATREAMVKELYPTVIVQPISDCRSNEEWSKKLDESIRIPFGDAKVVLYGSRDSFIPYYTGKNKTIELKPTVEVDGTAVRAEVSKGLVSSSDLRKGVIIANFARRAVTYPTVDVTISKQSNDYKPVGQILLGRKPGETLFRFIGGFVDPTDENYEVAAKREFFEETDKSVDINHKLKMITSQRINDWRYRGLEDGIMTTLFLGSYWGGVAKPGDDIEEVAWFDVQKLSHDYGINSLIVEEHRKLMKTFIDIVYEDKLIENIGEKLDEPKNVTQIIKSY